MPSSSKQIQINPELFNISGSSGRSSKNTTRKRKEKPVINTMIRPNNVKKELMKKIKRHQETKDKDKSKSDNIEEFTSQFNDSMKYLESVRSERQKNRFLKEQKEHDELNNLSTHTSTHTSTSAPISAPAPRHKSSNISYKSNINYERAAIEAEKLEEQTGPVISVNTELPNVFNNNKQLNTIIKDPPPYSNLKNSNKPTYKEWKRQTMKKSRFSDEIIDPTDPSTSTRQSRGSGYSTDEYKPPINVIDEHEFNRVTHENNQRKKLLDKIKFRLKQQNVERIKQHRKQQLRKSIDKQNKDNLHNKTVKNYEKYETFGKRILEGKVSVLVKDRQTRKKIELEKKQLRKHDIHKIRLYLQKHGLLKVGSPAPDDVLRELYEQSFLTGDVSNKSKDILVHNYLNDEQTF